MTFMADRRVVESKAIGKVPFFCFLPAPRCPRCLDRLLVPARIAIPPLKESSALSHRPLTFLANGSTSQWPKQEMGKQLSVSCEHI